MEYVYSKNRNSHEDLYDELRINFFRINNTYCEEKINTRMRLIPLFEIFEHPSIDFTSILNLATQTGGVEEAVETSGGDDEEKRRRYEDIIKRLIEEMKKLPHN